MNPNLKIGDKVIGKVIQISNIGIFIEIAPGIEGLIHSSEMSWNKNIKNTGSRLKIGDILEAKILTINRVKQKISLEMKQLTKKIDVSIFQENPIHSGIILKL